MRKHILTFLSAIVLLNVACGNASQNGLTVSVIPTQAYAIPFGSTTVNGNAITAPYFILNNVNLSWAGQGTLEIVTILIQTPTTTTTTGGTTGTGTTTTTTSVSCGIAGDTLTQAYPNNTTNGNVILNSNGTADSGQIPCSGISLPTPLPTSLNTSVQVQVIGIILDNNGNATGRITSTQNITLE